MLTESGDITEYTIPTESAGASIITSGIDGELWFTEYKAGKIGKITPQGKITEYALPPGAAPFGIAAGCDDAMWYTDMAGHQIGRLSSS
ncbi:virginiamycin B lyase, partial [Streptomyces sp. MS2A]|nr:virginiamycin B lyase [Streptomyces sp. MS2A]